MEPENRISDQIAALRGPILVLGASGFIGAQLFRILRAHRPDAFGVARELPAWRLSDAPASQIRQADLSEQTQLKLLFAELQPQTVFDCIAYGGYSFEIDASRIYRTNFERLTRLLPQLQRSGVQAYVHAGTSSEYGTNSDRPDEQAFLAPNSEYAVSKTAAAKLLHFYGRHRGLPSVNLRLYSVYGPGEDSSRLIPQLIQHGLRGELPEFADPATCRDFLYVDDAVTAFIHAALYLDEADWGESINVGTGQEWSLREVAGLACRLFHLETTPAFTFPSRQWDVQRWSANIERAKSKLRWAPQVDFPEGLQRTRDWYSALADKQAYIRNSKSADPAADARGDTAGHRGSGAVERLLNLNSLCNGADQTLLAYGRACLERFQGPLVGVEMGVAWGGGVEALAELWRDRGHVYGYDTFTGQPAYLSANPSGHEARCMEAHYQRYGIDALSIEYQRRHLDRRGLHNAVLVQGLVDEQSCDDLTAIHYCLLDLNMEVLMAKGYQAVRSKLVPGAFLCIHDYQHHPEVNRFLRSVVLADGLWSLEREYPDQDLIVLKRREVGASGVPRIHLYTICWNEAQMLPYFLRHYERFCEQIIVYDNGSDDGSQEIVQAHPRCQLRHIDSQGEMREGVLLDVKGHCWKESRYSADWVICCDIDEFLYHPSLNEYLADAHARGVTIPVPRGFQMISAGFPKTDGQLFEEIREGFPDDFYGKRVVFNPAAIDEINYSFGCHTANPTGNVREECPPELKMLHFKYLGREHVARRNALVRMRYSASDRNANFGHQYFWSPDDLDARFAEFERQAEPLTWLEQPGVQQT